ncbi:MAG: hypothetical protein VZR24_01340 [Butyrivibrio hungatei]|nr:hypothetical protein [Butyrivibrio hungatei]
MRRVALILVLAVTTLTAVSCGKREKEKEIAEEIEEIYKDGVKDGPTSVNSSENADEDSIDGLISSIKDYNAQLDGRWQTASMSYGADGSMQPEFYVEFTDSEIKYGHLKDDEFVVDHADKIESMLFGEKCVIQAISQNGVKYTYRTSESDSNILEYYETWNEEEYPDAYRGGASLSRCE